MMVKHKAKPDYIDAASAFLVPTNTTVNVEHCSIPAANILVE